MKTAVVILNWNTRDYLHRFLPGLLESCRGKDAAVIVADSASTDGSMEMMAQEFPQVRTIPLDGNYGFTGGYNRALAQLEAEYFVLINSDIEVSADWLEPLVTWMDSHPSCGACGPKLLSWYERDTFEYAGAAGGCIDAFGYPFCRGRVLKRVEKDHGQYDDATDVFWVSGACMMVRSSLWRALGGLDDRFFAHMEEIDLCWRMRLQGRTVSVVPQSVVYHIGGGTLPQDSPWKLELNYRNNLLMLDNNLARQVMLEGLPAGKSLAIARRQIFLRKCLDGMAAVVYVLQGHPRYAGAVWRAHRAYRRLRTPLTAAQLEKEAAARVETGGTAPLPREAAVKGVMPKSIIFAAKLHRRNIFEYVIKHTL